MDAGNRGARSLCLVAQEPGDLGRVPTFLLLVSAPESTNPAGSVVHSFLLVRDSRGALPEGEMHRTGVPDVGVWAPPALRVTLLPQRHHSGPAGVL